MRGEDGWGLIGPASSEPVLQLQHERGEGRGSATNLSPGRLGDANIAAAPPPVSVLGFLAHGLLPRVSFRLLLGTVASPYGGAAEPLPPFMF